MFIFFSFVLFLLLFFFNDPATTEIYTLSLHDALPISPMPAPWAARNSGTSPQARASFRSEEHTSELQSRRDLVCRLLLEKKNAVRSRARREVEQQHVHLPRPARLVRVVPLIRRDEVNHAGFERAVLPQVVDVLLQIVLEEFLCHQSLLAIVPRTVQRVR